MLLPVVMGNVSCVPENTLCELYGVKLRMIGVKLMELSRNS